MYCMGQMSIREWSLVTGRGVCMCFHFFRDHKTEHPPLKPNQKSEHPALKPNQKTEQPPKPIIDVCCIASIRIKTHYKCI